MRQQKVKAITCKHHLAIIAILFTVLSIFVYNSLGVKIVNDSHRYLEYATNLRNGFYFETHNFWYIGYVGFIYVIRLLAQSDNEIYLVMAQYAYSLIGLLFLYLSVFRLYNDKNAALAGSCLYLLFVEISFWNSYILCESFYLNTIIITFYLLVSWFRDKRISYLWILLTAIFILLSFLIKPTGIAILIAFFVTVYMLIQRSDRLNVYYIKGVMFAGIVLAILLLNKMLETYLIMENYQMGEIIYGITTVSSYESYQTLVVDPPSHLKILSDEYAPLSRLIYFIFFNFGYWLKLTLAKIFYFLLHVRPFWSGVHNVFNSMILIPLYILTIRQIFKSEYLVKVFVMVYLSCHIVIVGLTSVDWDGRFLIPIMPVLFILSAKQISDFFSVVIARKRWNRLN